MNYVNFYMNYTRKKVIYFLFLPDITVFGIIWVLFEICISKCINFTIILKNKSISYLIKSKEAANNHCSTFFIFCLLMSFSRMGRIILLITWNGWVSNGISFCSWYSCNDCLDLKAGCALIASMILTNVDMTSPTWYLPSSSQILYILLHAWNNKNFLLPIPVDIQNSIRNASNQA